MNGYTKLFSSILNSTIWGEDHPTRLCWITLLALSDRDGVAEVSIPGLAHQAHITVEEATEAIRKFQAPDPYSRTTEHEGRRIEPVPGGYRILNYEKYRLKMSREDMRERDRLRKQRQRDEKRSVPSRMGQSGTKRDIPEKSRKSDMAEAEAYAKPDTTPPPPRHSKDGVAYAAGVLTKLEIPSSILLQRAVGDAINFRCNQTGNPIEAECDFIIGQAKHWRESSDGRKVPRMSWLTWFQGQHYNDDPASWRSLSDKGSRFSSAVKAGNAAMYGEIDSAMAD